MRLILNKGQKKGMIGSKIIFQLTARVELTPEERAALNKYKFNKEIVYDKEKVAASDGSARFSAIARDLAAKALNLTITVDNLVQGRAIECKSITEIIAAEDAIMQACQILKGLLNACLTFDGETIHEI